jgi:hypothetical protein
VATRSTRGTPFNRDYREEEYREPGEGYDGPTPHKGLYPFVLERVALHTSQDGNEGVKWTFRATEDAESKDGKESYEGFRGFLYTNEEGAFWKEQQIMVAIGAIKPNGVYKGTLEALNKKYAETLVTGRVIRERYIPEDGEPEWVAKLTTVMKPRDTTETTPRRRTAKADDDLDDTADDVDEDVEEEETPRASSRRRAKPAPEPEPEDDEAEVYDLDELAEELEGLTLVALKKRAKEEFGFTTGQLRGLDTEDLIEKILDVVEEEQGAEDEEPEPEPPAKRARGRASTAKAGSRAKRSRDDTDQDPPF